MDNLKKKYDFCLSLIIILILLLLAMSGVRRNQEALASRIAPDILRFHVLANSDSPKDQALKLDVKEFLLEMIRSEVPGSATREELIGYIETNKHRLARSAEHFMQELGFDYPAKVLLETCEFPQKTYGDVTFPAGEYEAVRVVLGEGTGQNFWCVLYPSLCYIDRTYAIVPDSSKELLQSLLPEDDFHSLLRFGRFTRYTDQKTEQDTLLPRINIRFQFFEFPDHD